MNAAVVLEEEEAGSTDMLGLLDILGVLAQNSGIGHPTGVRALPY